MQDLTEVLGSLRGGGAEPPADAGTVAADVARGRRALAGRRHRRIAAAGFVAVAAVAAVTVGSAGHSGQSAPSAATKRTPAATQQTTHVQLTAYTGVQPAGFRVTTVPAGWKVISSTEYAFVVVPPTSTVHESAGHVSFVNSIAVMLQGDSHLPAGSATKVTVNGRSGQLGLTTDRTTKWLIFPDASGHQVLVQVFTKLGLTDAQIIAFAQGVTVTGNAHPPVG